MTTITEQLDLAFNPFEKRGKHGEWGAGAELKAHDTASATAKRDAALHRHDEPPELNPPVTDAKEFWGSLSDTDAAALTDYIGQDGSAAINGALRAGKMPGVGKAEPSDADMLTQLLDPSASSSSAQTIDRSAEVPVLDRIIASHTVTKTTTMYRGMAMSPALAAQLKPGAVFTDKGFTSTSGSLKWAQEFAHMRVSGDDPMLGDVPALGGKPAVMNITVPAGSHMAPGDISIKEYILPRGGSYRVDSISPDGGTYNLTALLPTPQQMIAGATPDNAVDVMRQLIAGGMAPKAAGDAVAAQLTRQGKAGQTMQNVKAQGFANDGTPTTGRKDAARAARLAWAEGEIEVQPASESLSISAQAALAGTITGQLDLSAIHGHHIPGTAYTYRHGFQLLVPGTGGKKVRFGQQFNDKYPEWMVDRDKEEKKAKEDAHADAHHADVFVKASVERTSRERYEEAPQIPSAQERKLTPEQQALVDRHDRMEAKLAFVYTPPGQRSIREQLAALDDTPKRNPAVEPPPAKPGTNGAELAMIDPALASLAAPGMSEDAIKKYIEARVSVEVARQVKEITDAQAAEMKKHLAELHACQQKTIAAVRTTYSSVNSKGDHDLRAHTVANSLFSIGGVAVALGSMGAGLGPVAALLASAVLPLVNVIHDYARNLG